MGQAEARRGPAGLLRGLLCGRIQHLGAVQPQAHRLQQVLTPRPHIPAGEQSAHSTALVGTTRPENLGRSVSQQFAHVESDFFFAPRGRGVLRAVGQFPPTDLKLFLSREKRVPEVRLF